MSRVLRLNPIACDAHGVCADLLPEMVTLDPWGYPVIAAGPVPPDLAALLLPIAPLFITPGARAGLFADPVPVPGRACPGDQLVAFLGRQPHCAATPARP